MRRICDCSAIVVLIFILGILTGCSSEGEQAVTVAETSEEPTGRPQPVTMKDSIEYSLNLALDRLRYGDRSGLYENEFEYMYKEDNFDEYLKYRHVRFAKADTIKWVEVVEVTPYDHDSAHLQVIVHFEGPAGIETKFPDRIVAYFRNGKWIKPTASNLKGQLDWEKSGQ